MAGGPWALAAVVGPQVEIVLYQGMASAVPRERLPLSGLLAPDGGHQRLKPCLVSPPYGTAEAWLKPCPDTKQPSLMFAKERAAKGKHIFGAQR